MTLPNEVIRTVVEHLQSLEGFEARAYKDSAYRDPKTGQIHIKYSIGYGHQIQPGEEHLLTKTLSKEDAAGILEKDVGRHLGWRDSVKGNVTRNQAVALTLLEYNVGAKASRRIATLLDQGRVRDAADAFLEYDKSFNAKTGKHESLKGLRNRRAKERDLFLKKDTDYLSPLPSSNQPSPKVVTRESLPPNRQTSVPRDATSNAMSNVMRGLNSHRDVTHAKDFSTSATDQLANISSRLESLRNALASSSAITEQDFRERIRKESSGL